MKTKDNLLKGIIIGISVVVLPLILMSTTNINNTNNEFISVIVTMVVIVSKDNTLP